MVIHPADRGQVLEKVRRYVLEKPDCKSLDYRVMTKEGGIRWIRARASLCADGGEAIQAVLLDVTEEKEQQRQNAFNEERYRIISELTRDTVFEWNLADDSIKFSPVYEKMFGFAPPDGLPISSFLNYDIVWETDKPGVARMIREVRGGAPYAEAEYRAKRVDGSYIWCRNRVTVIFDDERRPARAIGLLTDIDDYKRRTERLQSLAMRDSLTGLLNRMAMQNKVEECIQCCSQGTLHAFLQFDIDHFKQINDFMGHEAGDMALREIAARLAEFFRGSDLVCRMGGDEFAVFLRDIPSEGLARQRADQLLAAVRHDFAYGGRIYPLSISLGVALCPQDGLSFQALYQHADEAMYRSKRGGGNRVEFCEQSGAPE